MLSVQYVAPSVVRKIVGRIRKRFSKPCLRYVETHLTDHCNMNCRGCGHFAPLADPWFASIDQHDRDMRRLAEFFANIRRIRLMGGEPLLHPRVTDFLESTRRWFRMCNIRLVTNGMLLAKMNNSFWDSCRANKIGIDLTVYPLMAGKVDDMIGLVKRNGLDIVVTHITHFGTHRNLNGDSDPKEAMAICRGMFYCPYLLAGKLYPCALPALGHYFNKAFGTHIPDTGGVDIHTRGLTGRSIVDLLNRPVDACRHCSYTIRKYEWAISQRSVDEWDSDPAIETAQG